MSLKGFISALGVYTTGKFVGVDAELFALVKSPVECVWKTDLRPRGKGA